MNNTFDSSQYDVPTLVSKLQDQRFDGLDPESLAREVARIRDGGGTSAMGDAVDALKKVAGMLSSTDSTLRDQLSKLGVAWESRAGGQASTVLADQAGFSADANTKVSQAAQLIFQQGEAFNRTKNKLPDPEAIRKGEDGYTISDTLFSLFGFETDHASDVRAGAEAKAQAVDALNAYAHDSGNYLSASQPVDGPQSMELLSPPGTGVLSVAGPTITPVPPMPDVPAAPDTSPTVAAGTKDATPVASQPVTKAPAPPPAAAPAASAPVVAPIVNTPAPPAQGGTVPSTATPPAQAPGAPATGPITGVGGVPGKTGEEQPGSRPGGSAPTTGGTGGTSGVPGSAGYVAGPGGQPGPGGQGGPAGGKGGLAPGPGSSSGHGPGGPGSSSGGVGKGGPGGSGDGFAGGRGGGEALLGKGKMVGSTPGAASPPTNVGPGYAGVRATGGAAGLVDGVPAAAAAAGAGATSGEDEHERRRPGARGDASNRGERLPVGDLPEEEEAARAKKAAPEPPSRERTRSILEPAATQDGEDDGEHVRRYGVDDRDLFTDPREVSPDLIGEKRLPEE